MMLYQSDGTPLLYEPIQSLYCKADRNGMSRRDLYAYIQGWRDAEDNHRGNVHTMLIRATGEPVVAPVMYAPIEVIREKTGYTEKILMRAALVGWRAAEDHYRIKGSSE
jgi:hypothetical protein